MISLLAGKVIDRQSRPVRQAFLGEDRRDVVLDGSLGYEEARGDLFV